MQGIIEWFQSSATCFDPSESFQGPPGADQDHYMVLISTTQQEHTPEVAIELSGTPCKTLKTNQLVIDQSDIIIRDPSTCVCTCVCVCHLKNQGCIL